MPDADIAVIGAGAAGLFAAIWAGRTRPDARVIALDGATKLGAKILVAGGGRCNVTHDEVTEAAYEGSSRNAIRKVLKRFDVPETVAFFREFGVELKREDTGKLFPVTDSARTVLDALLRAADRTGAQIMHPRRVEAVERTNDGFAVRGSWGTLTARRVILATGGRSLPKSGSDGHGYQIAKSLGHTLTPRMFPALVPLTLHQTHPLTELSGISANVTLTVFEPNERKVVAFDGSILCTHFGLSGPVVLDISRYWQETAATHGAAALSINWLPGMTTEQVDKSLSESQKLTPLRWFNGRFPDRLARFLCSEVPVDPTTPLSQLRRVQRQTFARVLTDYTVGVTGTRGYTYAEVTAGGVPLTEIDLKTMESRICPGLYLCGELCDVDGRIGGYNFQWAWASGYVAGVGAAGL